MQLDLVTRRAAFVPATADESARTVEVIFSTGAPVRRRDAAGEYEERLSLDPQHVNVAGLVGAPLLDGHRNDSVEKILGVVTAARTDGTAGHATVRFSERADAVWRDVLAGVIRSVSVGYTVQKWADTRDNGARVRTAVEWTPRELSLVAIPADAGATVRAEGGTMEPETPAAERAAANAEIRRLATAAALDHTAADSLIDRGATVEQARAELFDQVLARQTPPVRHQRIALGDQHDAPDQLVARMSEALTCRLTGAAPKDEAARPYLHRRLVDLAAELLEARGERTRLWSPDTILSRAGMHTTGDFANLLTSTGNRILLAAFEAAPNPLRSLARRTTITDFRTKTSIKLSEWPKLSQVNEHGEVTHGTRGEAKEAYSLKTYAKIFSLSRQALVNDDLGAFADFGRAAGRAAAETEADVLTALLTANTDGVLLDDGQPLFDTTHANIAGSGTVIDVAALAAARLAMRSQKGLDGVTPVNAVPTFLLVSPTKETQAEQVLATLAAATTATVNPFSGRLTLLVEPRLSGNGWYVFADPAAMPVLEYAYLSSAQGPQMASREGWDVLGVEFRVVLDFGAGAVDHRGAYKNAGA